LYTASYEARSLDTEVAAVTVSTAAMPHCNCPPSDVCHGNTTAEATFEIISHTAAGFQYKPLECLFSIKAGFKTRPMDKGKRDG
jgi:hypothetical protein